MVLGLVLGGWAVTVSGCGSSPSIRYYQLSSNPSSDVQQVANVEKRLPIVGIGPVNIPSYADRLHLVTRAGPHELDVKEFDRWAEPLESDVSRVLVENLNKIFSGEQVAIVSWDGSLPTAYQVQVDVTRFDFEKNGKASLSARWTIVGRHAPDILALKTSHYSQVRQSDDYASMVAAMSQNLASLSQEISTVLGGLL